MSILNGLLLPKVSSLCDHVLFGAQNRKLQSSGLLLLPFISALEPAISFPSFTLPCTDSLSKAIQKLYALTLGFPPLLLLATGSVTLCSLIKGAILLNNPVLHSMSLHPFSLQYQFSCLPLQCSIF